MAICSLPENKSVTALTWTPVEKSTSSVQPHLMRSRGSTSLVWFTSKISRPSMLHWGAHMFRAVDWQTIGEGSRGMPCYIQTWRVLIFWVLCSLLLFLLAVSAGLPALPSFHPSPFSIFFSYSTFPVFFRLLCFCRHASENMGWSLGSIFLCLFLLSGLGEEMASEMGGTWGSKSQPPPGDTWPTKECV